MENDEVGYKKPPKKHQFKHGNKQSTGRPKFVFSELAEMWKAQGVERATKQRVIDAFEFLFGLSEDKIKEITDSIDGEYPFLIVSAAKELTTKSGKRFEMLKEMLDRAHGKAKQTTEHTGEVKQTIDLNTLSLEEKRKALELLQKADLKTDNE